LGEDHVSTLASASYLAGSLSEQGKYVEAEQINRDVLGARRRVLGEEHPLTLTSASNLASSLCDQKKHAEAEQMYHAVLATRRRLLGPTHPDTRLTESNLAILQSRRRVLNRSIKNGAHGRTAAPARPALYPAEAETRARVAEAELMAMLALDDDKPKGNPKGKAGKAGKPGRP
jgi:hypothetical protein